jgi:hypothetical protein
MKLTRALILAVLVLAKMSLFAPGSEGQGGSGTVTGRVTAGSTEAPLIGATVRVEGTALETQTDRSGAFSLPEVPAGRRVLRISHLGYADLENVIDLQPGETVEVLTAMVPQVFTSIEVREPYLEGQASALNQQKAAENIVNVVSTDQIGRFPDPNAAEAIQRLPGVTLQRDQGEGRFVVIPEPNRA